MAPESPASPLDAIPHMRDARRLAHVDRLQLDWVGVRAVEKAQAIEKEYGAEVDVQLIGQAGGDALANGVRASDHSDVLVARGCLCQLDGSFDALGDKGKGQFV